MGVAGGRLGQVRRRFGTGLPNSHPETIRPLATGATRSTNLDSLKHLLEAIIAGSPSLGQGSPSSCPCSSRTFLSGTSSGTFCVRWRRPVGLSRSFPSAGELRVGSRPSLLPLSPEQLSSKGPWPPRPSIGSWRPCLTRRLSDAPASAIRMGALGAQSLKYPTSPSWRTN